MKTKAQQIDAAIERFNAALKWYGVNDCKNNRDELLNAKRDLHKLRGELAEERVLAADVTRKGGEG